MADETAPGEPETTPSDTNPAAEPNPKPTKKTTTRRKIQLSREQWLTVALIILTIELAMCSILGSWRRVAAAHLIAIAIVLIVLSLRAAIRAASTKAARSNGQPGTTGGRKNPLSRLFGNRSSNPGGAGAGRKNPFSGLLGGRSSNPGGTGGRKNPLSGLFGKRPGSSNNGGGRKNPFSGLLGGRSSNPGGTGNRRNSADNPGSKPSGKKPGDLLGGLLGKKPGDKKPGDKKDDQKPGDKKDDQTSDKPDDNPDDETKGDPMTQPNPNPADEGGVRVPASAGLHLWGRTLPQVEQEALRLKAKLRTVEAEIDAFATDVAALATIGENEQVRSTRTVVSQLQSIAGSLRRIIAAPASEAIGKIAGQAAALWPTYNRDCAADEDRYQGARGTRRQERNADIGRAESDI